jgi:ribosomal protein S18 acetylase RimI-like enzyme
MTIEIRNAKKSDEQSLIDICFITGDPSLKKIFPEPRLFSYFWCLYYLWYELENCFVAEDTETNKVIGYIISTLDSIKQEKNFEEKIGPLVKKRMKEIKLRTIISKIYAHFIIHKSLSKKRRKMLEKYPAHLHINILPEYQRKGIGHRLMKTLEEHLMKNNIPGFHLEVGAKNDLGISFYEKYGLKYISKNHFTIIYTKKFIL